MKLSQLFARMFFACAFIGCAPEDASAVDTSNRPALIAQVSPEQDAQKQAAPKDMPRLGMRDSVVTCKACSPELLDAKRAGILAAMDWMLTFLGSDIDPRMAPITFHLEGDEVCGAYTEYKTGFCTWVEGKAHVCLFDVEKTNRAQPFDVAHASAPEDQMLPVHEAGHAWFFGVQNEYGIQEPFVKYLSFLYAGVPVPNPRGLDRCSWFKESKYPDRLMYSLCQLGMDDVLFQKSVRSARRLAVEMRMALTSKDFSHVLSAELGTDTAEAFRLAGLL